MHKEMVLTFCRLALLGPTYKHKDSELAIYYYTSRVIRHLAWGYNTVGRGVPSMLKALGSIPGLAWCYTSAVPAVEAGES